MCVYIYTHTYANTYIQYLLRIKLKKRKKIIISNTPLLFFIDTDLFTDPFSVQEISNPGHL